MLFLQKYTYKVRIINPSKKSDVVVRQLHHFYDKFESVIALHAKLIEIFNDQVPSSVTFDVGFQDGQKHCKMWIVTNDDLKLMYDKYPSGEITLWCEGRSEKESDVSERGRCKRKRDEMVTSKRQETEEEVDQLFKELKAKHANQFDTPKLRLWARMISSKIHDKMDEPPDVPAFHGTGSTPKKCRKDSLSDALSGAAIAFAKVLHPDKSTTEQAKTPVPSCLSPGKAIELRMKNFEQLRYLQQLSEDGILSPVEYMEQKQTILTSLRKL